MAIGVSAHAKVEALFHPHDPTLEKIAEWLTEANEHVDIAMYNMDTTDRSPVVAALKSKAVQKKISKGMQIRMVFEGYGTPAENEANMAAIEALGVDVRTLGKGVNVHHKFAVIDPASADPRLITGSANWSMSSYRGYNENILFFENEAEPVYAFQSEFNSLWANSKEYGNVLGFADGVAPKKDQAGFTAFFNSPRHLKTGEGDVLTDQIVRLIDGATTSLDIATTRIRLQPVMEALAAAADRDVAIRAVISQDDYRDLAKRAKWLLNRKNLELRVKFYNLRPSSYLSFQMHNKFMIADGETLLTGSFNWSDSSENNHIENLVEMNGAMGRKVIPAYQNEFESIWEMGRDQYPTLLETLAKVKAAGKTPKCGFAPTALTNDELTELLSAYPKCGG